MDAEATVREYYAALDDGRYDDLRGVLAPGFTQRRPDRTFGDREAFLAFVREDRPHPDTTHELDGVFEPTAGDGPRAVAPNDERADPADAETPGGDDAPRGPDGRTVVARGRVRTADGDVVVRFVDCFDVLAGRIVALDTYTR